MQLTLELENYCTLRSFEDDGRVDDAHYTKAQALFHLQGLKNQTKVGRG
jgi:hypothetical protein